MLDLKLGSIEGIYRSRKRRRPVGRLCGKLAGFWDPIVGDEKTQSTLITPTVIIHGGIFLTVAGVEPSFLSVQVIIILIFPLRKDQIAKCSLLYFILNVWLKFNIHKEILYRCIDHILL